MTASTIALVEVVLDRGRFGFPTRFTEPKDGILGAEHHNVATARYQSGTVLQLYNSGAATGSVAGWSEFVYGKFTVNVSQAALTTQIVVPTAITDLHAFTNDSDCDAATEAAGFAVVMISVLTTTYYGWFWSGGVAPIDIVDNALFAATDTMITPAGTTTAGRRLYALVSGENLGWENDPQDTTVVSCAQSLAADD